jgi:hypothetical protein
MGKKTAEGKPTQSAPYVVDEGNREPLEQMNHPHLAFG